MNRITKVVKQLQEAGDKAFVPFITAGFPDISTTKEIFKALEESGADIIELGMPFSDPLADGPTIQSSSHEAILSGTTPESVFELIAEIRKTSETPILLFAYSNLVISNGIAEFMKRLNRAGGDGILVPDMPIEESAVFRKYAKMYNVRMVFLISPLTPVERMKEIEKLSDDFVYCVSVAGVTGVRKQLAGSITPYLTKVRKMITKPFYVGFGVSSKEDAGNVVKYCNGVIVGSAIIKIIDKYKGKPNLIRKIRTFASGISSKIKNER